MPRLRESFFFFEVSTPSSKHRGHLKARSQEKHVDVCVHEDGSLSRCMTIKTCNTIVMERIWIGNSCFSTGAHDEHVIAGREELNLLPFFYR